MIAARPSLYGGGKRARLREPVNRARPTAGDPWWENIRMLEGELPGTQGPALTPTHAHTYTVPSPTQVQGWGVIFEKYDSEEFRQGSGHSSFPRRRQGADILSLGQRRDLASRGTKDSNTGAVTQAPRQTCTLTTRPMPSDKPPHH